MTALVNVAGLDGGAKPITLRSEQAADNSLSMHVVPEFGGAASIAPIASTVLEASHVFKTSAGTLFALNMNATISGYFMLFDAVSPPADGTVTPKKVWYFSASNQQTIDKTFNPPLAMSVGITVVFSSTGPFTKTAAPNAHISGEIA